MSKHLRYLKDRADFLSQSGMSQTVRDLRAAAIHLNRIEKRLRIARKSLNFIAPFIHEAKTALAEMKAVK